jgi:uncharacterized protein YdeI (YjbR/CyaY-like superfamily)
MNHRVDFYFDKNDKWVNELQALRKIVLDCGLTEELKWGVPCYTNDERNIVLIHTFKDYCALLFFKGALLHDPNDILVQQTKNVQAARQVRFTHAHEISDMKAMLKRYIQEAIEVEKAGLNVPYKKTSELVIPGEFKNKLDKAPELKTAFKALTPGRQRAYILYFSAPKQAKTRESRIEKYFDHILNGKGLND